VTIVQRQIIVRLFKTLLVLQEFVKTNIGFLKSFSLTINSVKVINGFGVSASGLLRLSAKRIAIMVDYFLQVIQFFFFLQHQK
jgi:hypothetical protein